MRLSEELKHWGYHSSISDEGKKQHLEMAKRAERLEPPLGWRCPVCGRGIAPDVRECSCCNLEFTSWHAKYAATLIHGDAPMAKALVDFLWNYADTLDGTVPPEAECALQKN